MKDRDDKRKDDQPDTTTQEDQGVATGDGWWQRQQYRDRTMSPRPTNEEQ